MTAASDLIPNGTVAQAGHHRRPPGTGMVLRVEAWPVIDRQFWEAGVAPATGLRRRRHADTLTPRSIKAAWESYGRFLAVLAERGLLNLAIGPAERVTFETVAVFFDAFRAAGNADNTIKARLFHLRMALHIMTPKADFDWITRPDGYSLDSFLQQIPSDDIAPPSSAALFKWGLELMADEPLPANSFQRTQFYRKYRDGLIIALLAGRAPRVGSLAQMRLGTNLYRLNGEYWAHLQSMIVKNKRELEYSLPPQLTPYIDRYLAEIRPVLLDAASTNALWGNGDGGANTYRAIETMMFRRTQRKFNRSFGPHAFRDAFASALATHDPRNPGLAAVILGITEGVVNVHYRKARQADAARKLQADLREERKRTRVVAEREFQKFDRTT
jgi:hypothetical protein